MALDGNGHSPASWPDGLYHGCGFVRTAGTAAHVSGGTEVSPRGHQRACTGKRPVSRGEACSASKQRRWWGSIRFRCASSHAASPGCFSAPPLSHTHTHLSSLVKGGEIGRVMMIIRGEAAYSLHHPDSINCGYLLLFESTIMENTADLAMVQKTIIDTLHKESKSQRVITERGGCSRSAVSKHIKYKVDWKEEIRWEKVQKQQGWAQAWEYCQAKPIQTLGRASQGVNWSWSQCIKSHHAQTSSGKELPRHFWNRNIVRSILPGIRRKQLDCCSVAPKSSFQMKVNFAFNL